MKNSRIKQYEYDGLGFPIILLNVPVREVRGGLVPDIDYNLLQRSVLSTLSYKTSPLTGSEVRFIRQYLEMTLSEFANLFGVTHATVIHWEKAKNEFAKLSPTTELCIRLTILDVLHANNKEFRDMFREFDCLKLSQELKMHHQKDLDDLITIDSKTLSA